jgi:DNA helicase-2/ATP-dependent DNA helicase PcrA
VKTWSGFLIYLVRRANPDDRIALRYWLGFGSTNWLKGQYAKLRASCEQTGLGPRETLEKIMRGEMTIAGIGRLVERYTSLYGQLGSLKGSNGQTLVDALVPEGKTETELLRSLMSAAVEGDRTDAARLVASIRVAVTQPEPPEEANCVRIMSLQKSKGLTSPVTVVAGCIESFVPTIDPDETPAEQAEILKEQRRLFYVAITRPKERLIISSFTAMPAQTVYQTGAKVGGSFGTRHTQPSRFIGELGPTAPKSISGAKWLKTDFA